MDKDNNGIRSLVKKYRKEFSIPENLDHYSKEGYLVAERKFVKYCLGGKCRDRKI